MMPTGTTDLVPLAPYTYERGPHGCNREGLNAQTFAPITADREPELPTTLSQSGDTRKHTKRGRRPLEGPHFLDPAGRAVKADPSAPLKAPVGVSRSCRTRVIPVASNDVDEQAKPHTDGLLPLSSKGNSVSPRSPLPINLLGLWSR